MQTEKPEAQKIIIASYLVLLGFLIIILRLWQLQLLQGEDLRKISESNRLRIIRVVCPPRHYIRQKRDPPGEKYPLFLRLHNTRGI